MKISKNQFKLVLVMSLCWMLPFAAQADITVENDSGDCGEEVDFPIGCGTIIDGLPFFTLVDYAVPPSGSFFPVGTTLVSFYKSIDGVPDPIICQMYVTVIDVEAPNQVQFGIQLELDENGNATLSPSDFIDYFEDNCGVTSVTLSRTTFSCADIDQFNEVIMTGTDASGNNNWDGEAPYPNFYVDVVDNTPPTALCKDFTVYLDENGEANFEDPSSPTGVSPALINLIDNGSSDNCGIMEYYAGPNYFTCDDMYQPQNAELHVTDFYGESSSCEALVTVVDNIAPVPICADRDVILDANGQAVIYPYEILNWDLNIDDFENCSLASLGEEVLISFDCSNIGPNLISNTVTDESGNTGSCSAYVNIIDGSAPNAPASPSALTVQCALDIPSALVLIAMDVCSGAVTGILSETTEQNNFPDQFILVRTWTFTDGSGNSSAVSQQITVNDSQPPVPVCEAAQTIVLNENCELEVPYLTDGASATDNCSSSILLTQSILAGEMLASGEGITHAVTITADDGNGNTATCTVTLTGDDSTPAVPTCEGAQTISLNADCALEVPNLMDGATATDNCATSFSWSQSIAAGDLLASGEGATYTVVVTVDDGNGNSSECEVLLTADDDTAPNTLCQDVTVFLDENGLASITPGEVDFGTYDNCGAFTLSLAGQLNYGCIDRDSSFVVTMSADDGNGNISTCTAVITVSDDNLPDNDCDGVSNICDICPTGDDSIDNNDDGIADCAQLLNYSEYDPSWHCGNNKIKVCHNGNNNPHTNCINKNALATHMNHGDYVGPCTSCSGQNLTAPNSGNNNVSSVDEHIGLAVFPNPTNESFTVVVPESIEKGKLTVMDITGRPVMERGIALGQTAYTFEKGNLPAGVYLVHVKPVGQPMQVIRLVVE